MPAELALCPSFNKTDSSQGKKHKQRKQKVHPRRSDGSYAMGELKLEKGT
jgi:hypothetical protein